MSSKYDKMMKDLYHKMQMNANADSILKQLAQTGKQGERIYLKLIEELRQKSGKQSK
jgi:hypothetical protein